MWYYVNIYYVDWVKKLFIQSTTETPTGRLLTHLPNMLYCKRRIRFRLATARPTGHRIKRLLKQNVVKWWWTWLGQDLLFSTKLEIKHITHFNLWKIIKGFDCLQKKTTRQPLKVNGSTNVQVIWRPQFAEAEKNLVHDWSEMENLWKKQKQDQLGLVNPTERSKLSGN